MEKHQTSETIKKIFKKNFNDTFIFDNFKNKNYTYGQFLVDVLSLQSNLKKFGLKKGDLICCLLENSYDFVVLYFASLLHNVVVVPVDPLKGENEIKTILEEIQPQIIFIDKKNQDYEKSVVLNELVLKNKNNYEKKINFTAFDNVDYNNLFLITFTSGSTGKSKGVLHSFNDLFLSSFAFAKKFEFNEKNIFFHNLPMTYMAGILNLIFLPFFSESKIVLANKFNFSEVINFWDLPIKYNVNSFWFIPTIIELLIRLDRGKTGINYTKNNKIIGCVATAPLNLQSKKIFEEKYQINLYESYGLSETLFVTTNSPLEKKNFTVGKSLDGVDLTFAENEIMIKTPWNFFGYFKGEKNYQSNEKFASGDLGCLDSSGFLKITGRKKDLIIKGGVNISPKKIEEFISNFDVYLEFVILGFPDKILGEKIVCFFIPKNPVNFNEKNKNLNKSISHSIGIDYTIDTFIQVDEIPKNLNGKIDKPKIIEKYREKIK